MIRRIGTNPLKVLGVFRKTAEGGRIVPIDKGADREWLVPAGETHGAKDGELVEAEQDRSEEPPRPAEGAHRHAAGRPVRTESRVADRDPPARHPRRLPRRRDRRGRPAGARGPRRPRRPARPAACHDRPVRRARPRRRLLGACRRRAVERRRPRGLGRHRRCRPLRPPAARRSTARRSNRGNSTYFPDRVVPMLPDRLSGDLCSLHEGVPRACVAVRMRIDAGGHHDRSPLRARPHALRRHRCTTRRCRTPATAPRTRRCAPLMDEVIAPLYAAYEALARARAAAAAARPRPAGTADRAVRGRAASPRSPFANGSTRTA